MTLLLASAAQVTRAQEQKPIVLSPSMNGIEVGNMQILEDVDNEFSIEDVAAGRYNDQFKSIKTKTPTIGLTKSSIWVKLTFQNLTSETNPPLIEINYEALDHIWYYHTDNGKISTQFGGDRIDVSKQKTSKSTTTLALP